MSLCPPAGCLPRSRTWITVLALLAAFGAASAAWAQRPVSGYSDYKTFAARLQKLDQSDLVTVSSLGKTLGGREILLATVSQGDAAGKPAWLVVGSPSASHLVGSEITVRMIEQMVEQAKTDEALKKLLARYALHFIPRPNPDASEQFFQRPSVERNGNQRPTDDDRDGDLDEDSGNDLNGDGWITMMRVEDPAGVWMAHPEDARILIKADPLKNERGRWSLYTEGFDDDEDGQWNEDGPGGVDFNRNFTYAYPYFQPGAGPHQVSEIETRAISDFAYDRLNIGLVFSFSPQDNLMHPWEPVTTGQAARDKSKLRDADKPLFHYLASKYRDIHGETGAPKPADIEGAFAPWAYFHYGRWSLSSPGWWPKAKEPQPPAKAEAEKAEAAKAEPAKVAQAADAKAVPAVGAPAAGDAQKPAAPEKKVEKNPLGADQLAALKWLEQEKIEGFIPWTKVQHRDFPGKTVEVGGFKPYILMNPPAAAIDGLAKKHVQFFTELAGLMPEIQLGEPKVEKLGDGVVRLTVAVINEGFLPTVSACGHENQRVAPTQLQVELPKGAKLITGAPRVQIKPLAGRGGLQEHTWLILVDKNVPAPSVKLKAWHPAVGEAQKTVELK